MMDRIARLLGAPSERIWPGMASLPLAGTLRLPHQPYNNLRRVREGCWCWCWWAGAGGQQQSTSAQGRRRPA